MKKLIWSLILPMTVISLMVFTKWWYVLVIDGPDEILTGFPFPFVCNGWHTSLSLQIFIFEFLISFLTYFLISFLIVYLIHRFIHKITLPRLVSIPLLIISSLLILWNAVLVSKPNNIFHLKRGFGMEIMETGFKFIWQKQKRPDFYKYHPEYKNNTQVSKNVIKKDWILEVDSIDTNTLIDYGQFLTDKNKVYYKYDSSDGLRIIELQDVDRESFETYGYSIYARDKNHIFDSRHGIIVEADIESFYTVAIEMEDGRVAHGKDKNNYYFWNKIVTDTIGFGQKIK